MAISILLILLVSSSFFFFVFSFCQLALCYVVCALSMQSCHVFAKHSCKIVYFIGRIRNVLYILVDHFLPYWFTPYFSLLLSFFPIRPSVFFHLSLALPHPISVSHSFSLLHVYVPTTVRNSQIYRATAKMSQFQIISAAGFFARCPASNAIWYVRVYVRRSREEKTHLFGGIHAYVAYVLYCQPNNLAMSTIKF